MSRRAESEWGAFVKNVSLVALGLLLTGAPASTIGAAERSVRTPRTTHATTVPPTAQPIGTITYDTGINVGFHPDAIAGSPNLNRIVGNRFNSVLGGPLLMTNMVHHITVFPANDGVQSVSFATAPTTMDTAMVLDYLAADLMANQFNALAVTPSITVGPDFLGFFLGTFSASQPAGLLGMSDMATMGQGYHAVQGFYWQGMVATMIQVIPNRNAMLRVTIDLIPVELMGFEIE
jgi:hypothetical protein